mgnify:CR=1 FL=1
MNRLPFFVYGTLIPDQPNYYLWKDSIVSTKNGLIKNHQLFDIGHYPMIVESKGNKVHGMLMYVKNENYGKITKIIDNLEGYNPEKHGSSAYNREIHDIELESGEIEKDELKRDLLRRLSANVLKKKIRPMKPMNQQ